MRVDVRTEIEIERPRDEVAAFAADPDNATTWYENIESVEWKMETTYLWEDAEGGATRMTLRNRGTPTGFSFWLSPLIAGAMRRANRKDLAALKALLEAS